MDNKTYTYYGSVLKGTDFYLQHDDTAYLPYSTDFSLLKHQVKIGCYTAYNSIEYQPMEGQDALKDGSPSKKTFERYIRLAKGGAGLLWFEAVSVTPDGRSNPYQLYLTEENVGEFAKLVNDMKSACAEVNGFEPLIIIQLNHSGRWSKPDGVPKPITAYFNSEIENEPKAIADDEFLEGLIQKFVNSSLLAEKAGFDGVDIKACHGYLMSELLTAFDRPGKYGGSFENRSRLFNEVTNTAFNALSPKMIRAARINIFDGYDGKYSFCKPEKPTDMYDLTEANMLTDVFGKNGGQLLNITMGSPYRNPDVSRPYRNGLDKPKTDAIFALYRLWKGADEIHKAHPDLKIVNTGISLLGALSPYAAAGAIAENITDFVGFGRMSFAYPELAKDILSYAFDDKKVCVACSGCSTLKKNILPSGCIIRNDYYKEIFKDWKRGEKL